MSFTFGLDSKRGVWFQLSLITCVHSSMHDMVALMNLCLLIYSFLLATSVHTFASLPESFLHIYDYLIIDRTTIILTTVYRRFYVWKETSCNEFIMHVKLAPWVNGMHCNLVLAIYVTWDKSRLLLIDLEAISINKWNDFVTLHTVSTIQPEYNKTKITYNSHLCCNHIW